MQISSWSDFYLCFETVCGRCHTYVSWLLTVLTWLCLLLAWLCPELWASFLLVIWWRVWNWNTWKYSEYTICPDVTLGVRFKRRQNLRTNLISSPLRVPGEIKRREVELDPQVSPEEIMRREVELGCESGTSFASGCSSTAVQRTLSLWLCPARQLKQQLRSALVAAQWRGDTALLPLFWRRSTDSPVFFGRYPRSSLHSLALSPPLTAPPLSPSLISNLASVSPPPPPPPPVS